MSDLFVEMPGQIEPFETPFDKAGRPDQPCQFVCLTNRGQGRYSGLLPIEYDWRTLGWGLADYFPQGYTNLRRLEKIFAVHPDPEARPRYKADHRVSPRVYRPRRLENRQAEIGMFLVFREPVGPAHPHDAIGLMFSERRAIAMAMRYAAAYGRRAVVGRLLADLTWH